MRGSLRLSQPEIVFAPAKERLSDGGALSWSEVVCCADRLNHLNPTIRRPGNCPSQLQEAVPCTDAAFSADAKTSARYVPGAKPSAVSLTGVRTKSVARTTVPNRLSVCARSMYWCAPAANLNATV